MESQSKTTLNKLTLWHLHMDRTMDIHTQTARKKKILQCHAADAIFQTCLKQHDAAFPGKY